MPAPQPTQDDLMRIVQDAIRRGQVAPADVEAMLRQALNWLPPGAYEESRRPQAAPFQMPFQNLPQYLRPDYLSAAAGMPFAPQYLRSDVAMPSVMSTRGAPTAQPQQQQAASTQDPYEMGLQRIGNELAAGRITPQQADQQMRALWELYSGADYTVADMMGMPHSVWDQLSAAQRELVQATGFGYPTTMDIEAMQREASLFQREAEQWARQEAAQRRTQNALTNWMTWTFTPPEVMTPPITGASAAAAGLPAATQNILQQYPGLGLGGSPGYFEGAPTEAPSEGQMEYWLMQASNVNPMQYLDWQASREAAERQAAAIEAANAQAAARWAAEMDYQNRALAQQAALERERMEMQRQIEAERMRQAQREMAASIGTHQAGLMQQSWAQGMPYALPTSLQYAPGFEPGGPLEMLYQRAGATYSPEQYQLGRFPAPSMSDLQRIVNQAMGQFGPR